MNIASISLQGKRDIDNMGNTRASLSHDTRKKTASIGEKQPTAMAAKVGTNF